MRIVPRKQGEFRSFSKEISRDKYTLKNFRKPIILFVFITETEAGNAGTRGKHNLNVFFKGKWQQKLLLSHLKETLK